MMLSSRTLNSRCYRKILSVHSNTRHERYKNRPNLFYITVILVHTSKVVQPHSIPTAIRRNVPFSILERAQAAVAAGLLNDVQRVGMAVSGLFCEESGEEHVPTLTVNNEGIIEPSCTCCSTTELADQWCPHITALALKSLEMGALELRGGTLTLPGIQRSSSTEALLATVAEHLNSVDERLGKADIKIIVVPDGSKLRLSVYVNGTIFTSDDTRRRFSTRELDNIFLSEVRQHLAYDFDSSTWSCTTAQDFERIIGLLSEFNQVLVADESQQLTIATEFLNAELVVTWHKGEAKLITRWLDSNDEAIEDIQFVGPGPRYGITPTTLYRLTTAAGELSLALSTKEELAIPRAKLSPLLRILMQPKSPHIRIRVTNPAEEPKAEVVRPVPHLEILRNDTSQNQGFSVNNVELRGQIRFEYPAQPEDTSRVFIPDDTYEADCLQNLTKVGFKPTSSKDTLVVNGDPALDVVWRGAASFQEGWEIVGLPDVQRTFKFSQLALDISVGAVKDHDDVFKATVALLQNGTRIPLNTLFKVHRASSELWVQLDSGAFARIPGGGFTRLKSILGMIEPNFRLLPDISSTVSRAQAATLAELRDADLDVKLDPILEALHKRLSNFNAIKPVKPSPLFKGTLRPYQEEGLSWLMFLRELQFGGILADEMGLGKTIQTLALIQKLKAAKKGHEKLRGPCLIVAPTSVIPNWAREAGKFTPNLNVVVLQGPNRHQYFADMQNTDLILTSYALLRLDRPELEKIQFDYIVLDEAQNIKNPQAATTQSAKALKAHARLALTGTPTENRPMELWSILDFLMPGYLGSNEFFKNNFERPIMESEAAHAVTRALAARVRPFILRRTKAEVEKELPPKIESVMIAQMSPEQRDLYNSVVAEMRPKIFDVVAKKGVRGATVSILAALMRLRQICNHPNSIDGLTDGEPVESGKFELLKELITEAVGSGGKILLFCQFLDMISIIRGWLEQEGIKHVSLDGSTRDRQGVVDKFNNDPDVKLFLISLKAGGTGLNLATADTVIIYDPWWNPAVEDQAIDRAHRIGQKRTVNVYRLVTELSIEERIMELKSKKARIIDALVNGAALSTLSLSKGDLEELLQPVG